MNLITINEEWPIRVAKHKVLYRKAYPLTEFDVIILSFLNLYNDTISYDELGSVLGFAVEANEEEQVYFDKAETGIFSSLLDTLSEYKFEGGVASFFSKNDEVAGAQLIKKFVIADI